MQKYVVVAYKVDCGYCGTDTYDFGMFRKEVLEDELHQAAMEWDDSYGYQEQEAMEFIEEGYSEEEAWEAAHESKQGRVGYEYKVLLETEDKSEAVAVLKDYQANHCASTFIPDPF